MTSAVTLLVLAALIVGVAKALSFWNGIKTERLKNAEDQVKRDVEANTTSNRITSDAEFRDGVRNFFSDE